jgi:hypothetical protein
MEAPPGGSSKQGPLGPDSLLHYCIIPTSVLNF